MSNISFDHQQMVTPKDAYSFDFSDATLPRINEREIEPIQPLPLKQHHSKSAFVESDRTGSHDEFSFRDRSVVESERSNKYPSSDIHSLHSVSGRSINSYVGNNRSLNYTETNIDSDRSPSHPPHVNDLAEIPEVTRKLKMDPVSGKASKKNSTRSIASSGQGSQRLLSPK